MSPDPSFSFQPEEIRPNDGRIPERSTAGAFLVRKGMLLLERRPDDARVYPGFWDTPGGHVKARETPEEALQRELLEELGIVPEGFILGMVQDDREPVTGKFYRHFVYVVHSWRGTLDSREGRTIQWFSFEEALNLTDLNPLIGFALESFMARGWMEE